MLTIITASRSLNFLMNKLIRYILFLLANLVFFSNASAQTLGQGQALEIPWLRLVFGLLLCLVLAVLVILTYRKRFGSGQFIFKNNHGAENDTEPLEILSSQRVTTDNTACVLKYRDVEFLVLIGTGNTTLIREFDRSES